MRIKHFINIVIFIASSYIVMETDPRKRLSGYKTMAWLMSSTVKEKRFSQCCKVLLQV